MHSQELNTKQLQKVVEMKQTTICTSGILSADPWDGSGFEPSAAHKYQYQNDLAQVVYQPHISMSSSKYKTQYTNHILFLDIWPNFVSNEWRHEKHMTWKKVGTEEQRDSRQN